MWIPLCSFRYFSQFYHEKTDSRFQCVGFSIGARVSQLGHQLIKICQDMVKFIERHMGRVSESHPVAAASFRSFPTVFPLTQTEQGWLHCNPVAFLTRNKNFLHSV